MLRLPVVRYMSPTTLEEAVKALAEDGAMLAAGGTDLVPNLKRRQYPQARTIVSLRQLPDLRGIRLGDGSIRIGALTTVTELASDERVPDALRQAARSVAFPQVRNQGTVGGNLCVDTRCDWLNVSDTWRQAAQPCLKAGGDMCWVAPAKKICWAVSSSDLAPVMVALDAAVNLVGPAGERTIPAAELYRDDGMDHLAKEPDEILTEITVPSLDGRRAGYGKLRRRGSVDFPILGVAAALRFDGGRCTDARIVLGAVASAPIRVPAAEEIALSEPWTDELVYRVAEAAWKAVRPMSNTDLTSRYRKRMVPVYVRRLLTDLAAE